MSAPRADLFEDLARLIRSHGVDVRTREMDIETPGEFDGPTITINPVHNRQALSYYLAHSFGSIYQWSTNVEHAQAVFDALREAKKGTRPRFEPALERWRRFEEISSEHAVWALAHVGHAEAIEPYTVFFRADIEAMTIFHRTGKEPQWPEFFHDWKDGVARGTIRIEPFRPKPVTRFRPVKIATQEVVQERD